MIIISSSEKQKTQVTNLLHKAFTDWKKFPVSVVILFPDICFLARIFRLIFIHKMLQEKSEYFIYGLSECMA